MQQQFTRNIFLKATVLIGLLAMSSAATAVTGSTTTIVGTTADFIAAVSPGSPYTKVMVNGTINGLANVQLKENLIVEGVNESSELVIGEDTVPKSDLLIVSKNDQIRHINLHVNNYSGSYAIRNINGSSVGTLNVNDVTSNGEISVSITDGSDDSIVKITNTHITLNNMPSGGSTLASGIELTAQQSSKLTVQQLHNNIIQAMGQWNSGIYTHAHTLATIIFNEGLHDNNITTDGKQSMAIYNFSDGALVKFTGGITHNVTQSDMSSYGIFNNTARYGKLIIDEGIQNNTITTHNILAFGIANQAQTDGEIIITGNIQHNHILTSDTGSTGFNNCAGECDTSAGNHPRGTIDLSHAQVINNDIVIQYDDTDAIDNNATGEAGTLINFGMGSSDQVAEILNQDNQLHPQADAKPVGNYTSEEGVIN